MSSRYYSNNNYFASSPSSYYSRHERDRYGGQHSSYSRRSRPSASSHYSKGREYREYNRTFIERDPPRPQQKRHSHRDKVSGHWKQKEVKKEVVQKEQRGEFNQRDIERELNKYKKGVFYQQPNTTNQNSKYSQFQLTRTEKKAPPKIYREDINGNKSDDDHKEKEKITTKKREKKREKKRTKQQRPRQPMVTVQGSNGLRMQRMAAPDYYYNSYYRAAPNPYYAYPPYPEQYEYYGGHPNLQNYDISYSANMSGAQYGQFGQYDGSWYPYPEVMANKMSKDKKEQNIKKEDKKKKDKTKESTKLSPGRRVNKIQKQLEYYFSRQNMKNDEFLMKSMDDRGWVNIEVIAGFNRMKVLGATKELVVEAAFHSTLIEIDSKNPEKIRMTKYWKEFVAEKKQKERRERKRKEIKKQQELDNAELNTSTIESIVAGIEKKHEKRKKRREEKERKKKQSEKKKKEKEEDKKEKEKEEEQTTTTQKEEDDTIDID